MLKPIFFKEFEKIRWSWLTLLALNGLLVALIYIDTRQLFIMDHAEIVWYRVIQLDDIFYSNLKYAPVFTGLLLACVQFIPEMAGERLRLSLHLPISPHLLILGHVLVGLIATGIILFLDMAVLIYIVSLFFPIEVVNNVLFTALPWIITGFAAYLGVTLTLLEPKFKLKAFNLGITFGVVGFFLQSSKPGAYLLILPVLICIVLLMVPAVFLPAYRFRYRSDS
ncbi:MAG: hypothetical protein KAR45_15170 [Desulfobacteraceae bacterium]|nr:hypothetical protein [Desulfobacteraceae bacterium]